MTDNRILDLYTQEHVIPEDRRGEIDDEIISLVQTGRNILSSSVPDDYPEEGRSWPEYGEHDICVVLDHLAAALWPISDADELLAVMSGNLPEFVRMKVHDLMHTAMALGIGTVVMQELITQGSGKSVEVVDPVEVAQKLRLALKATDWAAARRRIAKVVQDLDPDA